MRFVTSGLDGSLHKHWWPSSWRMKVAAQQPEYEDANALNAVLARLRQMAPFVRSSECIQLKYLLAHVAQGRGFLLHGGDCVERFSDIHPPELNRKVRVLAQMGLLIQHATQQPVVHLARMAGQFAMPRSQGMEVLNGVQLPVYRGDLVNDVVATPQARRSDPDRLLRAYLCSATVMNHVRSIQGKSLASLGPSAEDWRLDVLGELTHQDTDYRQLIQQLSDIQQMTPPGAHEPLELFMSHEGLHLAYEESLTGAGADGLPYNLSTHYLWLGEWTRQLDGAHIEYFRGIHNPIGVKIGPDCEPDELEELVWMLNPTNEPGRLTLITRFGKDRIASSLPPLIQAVRQMGAEVIWSCDPMHGNGLVSSQGIKTCRFESILSEVRSAFEIHDAEGSHLGGLHLECTGSEVTECLGGSAGITEEELTTQYTTACDPRLNASQALELVFLVSDCLRRQVFRKYGLRGC
ncbi:3-deoxy-7-phosphoheptulonate synthase class II [Archangium sp.]|uniref:3-deoxy-7-phosphoheptulonate synthase class II n=1 Tax=Archangium sp. TaxID=1872627 RepID=UPI002D5DF436|nr:3-deoxy-7-phosphoheptulonate synthase class II [Archangium sp.]HYO54057.1 3-deoxy-7-phosphoheptulonate synthase class II [Archangium sp.]